MLRKANHRFHALLLTTVLLLVSCSGSGKLRVADDTPYKIRPGDIVEVKFEYYPDFDQIVIIPPDGLVPFNAVGKVDVFDLSRKQLQEILNEKYSRLLAMPRVDVKVHDAKNFTVYVGGDINNPGMVKFRSNLTLLQGLLLAGGLKNTSSQYEVYIFRSRGSSGMKTFKFDLSKNNNVNNAPRDFQLAPYDVVFVLKANGVNNQEKKAKTI